MLRWYPSTIALLLVIAGLPARAATAQDSRCGSYCLYVALKSLELGPDSFEELEQRLGDPEQGGYTMEQLDQAAQSLGAKTIAVRTTLENLASRPESFACIALINNSHFILLYDSDQNVVRLCDPPGLKEMPVSTFRSAWSGEALLLGNSDFLPEEAVDQSRRKTARIMAAAKAGGLALALALVGLAARAFLRRRAAVAAGLLLCGLGAAGCSPSSPAPAPDEAPGPIADSTLPSPGLRALTPRVDLGVIRLDRPNQTVVAEAMLQNDGPTPIKVETIVPSCSCTSVRVEPLQIDPGTTAKLVATIRVANSSEDASTQVLIHTSEQRDKPLAVAFMWKPRNPLSVETPHLALRAARPGQSASQSIPIRLVGLSLCPDCRFDVQSSHPGLNHRLDLAKLPRTGHEESNPEEDVHTADLMVSTAPKEHESSERAVLNVSLRCGDTERARLDLPITWMVVPAIGVAPRRLFIGTSSPGQTIRRKLTLSAAKGQPFVTRAVETESDRIHLEISDQLGESRSVHVIDLGLTAPTATGPWSDNILIQTDSAEQPTVVVPVAGVVEG